VTQEWKANSPRFNIAGRTQERRKIQKTSERRASQENLICEKGLNKVEHNGEPQDIEGDKRKGRVPEPAGGEGKQRWDGRENL